MLPWYRDKNKPPRDQWLESPSAEHSATPYFHHLLPIVEIKEIEALGRIQNAASQSILGSHTHK